VRAASAPAGATAPAADGLRVVPLPSLPARHVLKSGADEAGWTAIALATDTKDTRYPVAKGTRHEWVAPASIELG
jgi:hypothetical protein